MTKRKKPKVTVVYRCRGCWDVWIDAPGYDNEVRQVIVAAYQTRDSANAFAKNLRRALRGG
jgi:hypothetical protein